MRKYAVFALQGAALVLLAGCGDKERASESIDKAEGEILTRSVTDEMLPYEQLRSQPPLADPEEAGKAGVPGATREGGGSSPDGDGGADAPAADAPAAEVEQP